MLYKRLQANVARRLVPWTVRQLTPASYRSQPAFLGIGAQKGGTSALHRYLSLHPQIVPALRKEIKFFYSNYERGIQWYHDQFPLPFRVGDNRVTFEISPEYFFFAVAAQRIYNYNPQIKMLVCLRDPITRAFSQWNMLWGQDQRPDVQTFEERVDQELEFIEQGITPIEEHYPYLVQRGIYHEQLTRYFELFPREQFFICGSADLRHDTSGMLHQVTDFLGLQRHQWENEQFASVHVRSYEKRILPATKERLKGFFRPHNEKLYELLGVDYGWE